MGFSALVASLSVLPVISYEIGERCSSSSASPCSSHWSYTGTSTRLFNISIAIPTLIFFRIVPESIRWLITKKRLTEARDLIDKAAKMNGKTVPEHLLFDALKSKNIHAVVEEPPSPKSETFVQIFRTRVLCIRIFVMCSAW